MRLFRISGSVALLTVSLTSLANAAQPAEERLCGWYENSAPRVINLIDHEGSWKIATADGYNAPGQKPVFRSSQWIRTNGDYGYGCACVSGELDEQTHTVNAITTATARTLSACRADTTLREPSMLKGKNVVGAIVM
ncbi:hypothetical protein PMM47T1_04094 [Pseudomonas sp. M47T1]|uniref:DUF4087 domain-containing protein n=1 Tax=unclassified Pseudomonas TaxID=196821 RepID=UPI0002607813|nr:DUF4087 domain-containing protein [Pseudomonas sp. M47T1]EIK97661.1 hypothetical protein PMM47T1_04094 [Pseudomonas sp. M47T1]